MRAIDADALMPKMKFISEAEYQIYGRESWNFAKKCMIAVDEAPTITVASERKTGRWIVHYECPKCGEITKDFTECCPFCGADMRGEQDG